jgi:hypothetical protein
MTPRRIVLLVAGLLFFGTAYYLYARFFGWIDGLPVLPQRMLMRSEGTFRLPERPTSPTIERLKIAFGENSPETEPSNYTTQLEFVQNPETSVVLACGSPPSKPNSNRVTLTPFSVAVFKKARPEHLREPGEIDEISTIHSDKGILEFDRVIRTPTDMNNAKLVRLELISDPEQALPDALKRVGKVHITNNQRSSDPNRTIVLKSVGPVFYIDQKPPPGAPPPLGPDIWTDAPVEIVDRSNMPRRTGAKADTAPSTAEEVRNATAVDEILTWRRLPPPTLTAIGLRVYLEHNTAPKPVTRKQDNGPFTGFSGVRRVEFLEKVLMNLWIEGGQSMVGAGGKPSALPEPSDANLALLGGVVLGEHVAREMSRELLQVDTRGPFTYDSEKHTARFEVLPLADPNLTNDVRVTKVPARPGVQTLFSQILELEFYESQPSTAPEDETPTPPQAEEGNGRFKRLHAWTDTPGRLITLSSDADQLEAYGQDLVYEQNPERAQQQGTPNAPNSPKERMQLRGSPLTVIQQQRNVLRAGGGKQVALLTLEPAPGAPAPKQGSATGTLGSDRRMQATVLGFGQIEMYDEATNKLSTTASWRTSLVQTKERVNDQELDLFTFTDDARFEDVRSDYWLKGKVLKVWLTQPPPGQENSPGTQAVARGQPRRLQAIGDVSGHSVDLDIEYTETLNSYIRDTSPPADLAGPQPPTSPQQPPRAAAPSPQPMQPGAPALAPPADPGMPAPEPKEPEKPKPPTKIRARTIDTWVNRYPLPTPPAGSGAANAKTAKPGPNNQQANGGMKYQLEKADCEGMVTVHQDPADSTKPRGTDILGSKLEILSSPEGHRMTVFGWENRPGEVHNEGSSLIGPIVVIDQVHNFASVEGRGSLVLPASSDLSGAELKQPESVVIHFRDGMKFFGAKKLAEFFGKVNASQGASWVACHTMQVNFDRPVYFTQLNRPETQPKPVAKGPNAPKNAQDEDKPKVDVVYCYPAPGDAADGPQEKQVWFNQVDRDPVTGKITRRQTLKARELTLRAQARDPGNTEPYRLVLAEGPGTVRTWQMSSKDEDAGVTVTPKQPATTPQQPEGEMKLTVVEFGGRMTAKDKGPAYQSATFLDSIQVIQVPTEDYDLQVDRTTLVPRAVTLSCHDQLTVWAHKKGNDPPVQHMIATGNGSMQNDEYMGWGDTITVEGKLITLEGVGIVPARIKSRFKGNEQSGKKIILDRATNHFEVQGSIGGTLSSDPPPKPATPMPNPMQGPMTAPMQKPMNKLFPSLTPKQ